MKFYQAKTYQPKCNKLYEIYKNAILGVLPLAQIEHIGSSAIPNCISKGDLDIYVAVEKNEHCRSVTLIENLGFKIKQDTLRTRNLCMLEKEEVAIQLVASGSQFEDFLHFRAALLKTPQLVGEYNKLKRNCEALSMTEYRLVKSKFIEKILSNY